jgi:hypothetical protein
MTAAYQDKRITILDEGITVGDKAFTMNLVNHASVLKGDLPLGKVKATVDSIFSFLGDPLSEIPDDQGLFAKTVTYQLVLDIAGNDQVVLSSKDKDYIHMLAGIINAFKGYVPQSEPSFDYEGEVLE